MITLVKMNEEKFKAFVKQSQEQRATYWLSKDGFNNKSAKQKALSEFNNILGDGLSTKGNFLYNLVDAQGTYIGYLWYTLRSEGNNKKAFICDFFVKTKFRRLGYGRYALELLSREVKAMGLSKIGLSAIVSNEPAINLYKSIGFKIKSVVMEVELGG